MGMQYAPPPPTPPPAKSNTTMIIIIVVVVLLLCCCCALGATGYYLYQNGGQIFGNGISALPYLRSVI
jgi:hypothetical protein